jgi:Domain of unknown function (DU1801)
MGVRGVPVWSPAGIICSGETYKQVVLTFVPGAALKDPRKLFNARLAGNVRRAIDLHENEELNAPALRALVRAALELNEPKVKGKARSGEWPRALQRPQGSRVVAIPEVGHVAAMQAQRGARTRRALWVAAALV